MVCGIAIPSGYERGQHTKLEPGFPTQCPAIQTALRRIRHNCMKWIQSVEHYLGLGLPGPTVDKLPHANSAY